LIANIARVEMCEANEKGGMFFLGGVVFGGKQPQISLKMTSKLTKLHFVGFMTESTDLWENQLASS